jgi:alpha-tubulin suppressor-like RCC1 family protein
MKTSLFVTAAISALCATTPLYTPNGGLYAQNASTQRALKKGDASEVQEVWRRRVAYFQDLSDEAADIAIDQSGNIYVTGKVTDAGKNYNYGTTRYNRDGNIAWGPIVETGLPTYDEEATAIALDDAYVYVTGRIAGPNGDYSFGTIKYDRSDGNRVWSRQENGDAANPDEAVAIAVDAQGNVYVAGNSFSAARDLSYKVVKYDRDGNLKWTALSDANENSANPDNVFAMALDAAGNVYVTGIGYDRDEALDDYMTIKYDGNSGQAVWKSLYHGSAEDQAVALALDQAGHVYVTGRSKSSFGDWDLLTIEYNAADGAVLKTVTYNGGDNDMPTAMAIDASGNVFVTGGCQHSYNNYDYLTIKYDADLDSVWTRRYNNPGMNDYEMAKDLALDAAGNAYVTGTSYRGENGGYDYATVKYDPQGAESWVIRYEGPGDDIPNAIALDQEGNVYVTGYSEKSPGADEDYLTIKYEQSTVTGVEQPQTAPVNDYELAQNYPNPFNPETKFAFALPQAGEVKLNIYALTGQLVRTLADGTMAAGRHEIPWNGQDQSGRVVANGVYWYQLVVTGEGGKIVFRETKKMAVLK